MLFKSDQPFIAAGVVFVGMCGVQNDKPDGVHPRMEKYALRKAFDTPGNPYLPVRIRVMRSPACI